jgi:hypothetical protein
MEKPSSEINVGIDVEKTRLGAYIHEWALYLSVENSAEGIRMLLARVNR